jgi:hypothetical protein
MTLNEYAKEYVDTILSPANGWGQHVHPTLGRSDYIMLEMFRIFGDVLAQEAITIELKNRRN